MDGALQVVPEALRFVLGSYGHDDRACVCDSSGDRRSSSSRGSHNDSPDLPDLFLGSPNGGGSKSMTSVRKCPYCHRDRLELERAHKQLDVQARRIDELTRSWRRPDLPISTKERLILEAFAEGLGYQDTAERMGIALDTVRTHVRRVYAKLGVRTAAHAVAVWRRDENS